MGDADHDAARAPGRGGAVHPAVKLWRMAVFLDGEEGMDADAWFARMTQSDPGRRYFDMTYPGPADRNDKLWTDCSPDAKRFHARQEFVLDTGMSREEAAPPRQIAAPVVSAAVPVAPWPHVPFAAASAAPAPGAEAVAEAWRQDPDLCNSYTVTELGQVIPNVAARLARHGAAAGPGLAGAVGEAAQAVLEAIEADFGSADPDGAEDDEAVGASIEAPMALKFGHIRRLRAALAGGAGSGWRPIETAPRGGTRILGFDPDKTIGISGEAFGGVLTVCWSHTYEQWRSDPCEASEHDPDAREITHWQPLPAPPRARQDGGGDA